MKHKKEILQELFKCCLPIAIGFIAGGLVCLLISLSGCRTQKLVTTESVHYVHDTTAVHDTLVVQRIVGHEKVTHDTTVVTKDVSAQVKHATFDNAGNLKSMTWLNYNLNSRDENRTLLSDVWKGSTSMEKGHSETAGKAENAKHAQATQIKPALSGTQKTIVVLGALSMIAWVLFFLYKLARHGRTLS